MKLVKNSAFLFIALLVVVIIVLILGANFLGDWMWFQSLGYENILITTILARWGLRIATILFFWFVFSGNLFLTLPVIQANWRIESNDNVVPLRKYIWERFVTPRRLRYFFLLAGLVLSILLGPILDKQWLAVLQYLNAVPFAVQDPLFNLDISFFIFKLPIYNLVYNLLVTAVVSSIALVAMIYGLMAPWELIRIKNGFSRPWKHLGILVTFFLGLKAVGYLLEAYQLVYSPRGVTFGAGYTDVHAHLPMLRILTIIALIAAVAFLFSIFANRWKVAVAAILFVAAASGILGTGYPALMQRFQVEPNEMAAEEPYLKHNIEYTQKAYDLEQVEIKEFPALQNLTREDLNQYENTITNIRLWDWRPLSQTYNQLQTLRPYYRFKNVDIDRYMLDGKYQQVMLAARELEQSQLSDQAQTWVNQKLRFTHGYGAVANPVSEVTSQGLPNLILSDIPPQGPPELAIERPQIYYGEVDNPYIVANSKTAEFDYPKGSNNSYNHYEGNGGIKLDSFFKRLIFAVKFADYRLIFTGELTPESRLMFNRNITQRLETLAPFLTYDNDPYLVINNGKLYWIIDAYTTSELYPYAEPFQGALNYIKNPVKVVIDAYHGSVDFFLVEEEPIAKSLNQIFGDIFKPFAQMPEGLKEHIRYPESLFNVQAKIYTQYHMENPQVFYNREDAWEIPQEIFSGEQQQIEPYYSIVQLPGNEQGEYILMLPFKPARQLENMVAWMAGRSDGDNYGKLLLYTFPKGNHVYGTTQVEARIDQDSEISQQLTLWDQRGSQVIRGNLLVIPVAESLLYVEPIFLQAEQSQLPELTRVIVTFGEEIVMERTLEEALTAIFGVKTEERPEETEENGKNMEEIVDPTELAQWQRLAQAAGKLFEEAQAAQRAGDWATYGEKIELLEEILSDLQKYGEETLENTLENTQ